MTRSSLGAELSTLVVGLCVLLPASSAGAQEPGEVTLDIFGAVVDARTGDPVPEMEVVVRTPDGGRVYRTLASAKGRFRVTVDSAGRYVIATTRLGYRGVATTEVDVEPGQDLYVELEVEPEALGVEPIRVTVTARSPYLVAEGFYERMERGWGRYIEREAIERAPTFEPTGVLRGVPQVRTGGGNVWIRRCGPEGTRLLIDGMEIDTGEIPLDAILDKDQVAAIEVYDAPETVPVDLRRHQTCGVIAIWTTWGEELPVNR